MRKSVPFKFSNGLGIRAPIEDASPLVSGEVKVYRPGKDKRPPSTARKDKGGKAFFKADRKGLLKIVLRDKRDHQVEGEIAVDKKALATSKEKGARGAQKIPMAFCATRGLVARIPFFSFRKRG